MSSYAVFENKIWFVLGCLNGLIFQVDVCGRWETRVDVYSRRTATHYRRWFGEIEFIRLKRACTVPERYIFSYCLRCGLIFRTCITYASGNRFGEIEILFSVSLRSVFINKCVAKLDGFTITRTKYVRISVTRLNSFDFQSSHRVSYRLGFYPDGNIKFGTPTHTR